MKLKYFFLTVFFIFGMYINLYQKETMKKYFYVVNLYYIVFIFFCLHVLSIEFIKTISLVYYLSFLGLTIPFLICIFLARLDLIFGRFTNLFEYLGDKILLYFKVNPILLLRVMVSFPSDGRLRLAEKSFICFLILRFFSSVMWWKYLLGFFSLSQYEYLQTNCNSLSWMLLTFSMFLFFKNYKIYFFEKYTNSLTSCKTFKYTYYYCFFLQNWLKIALFFCVLNCISIIILDVNLSQWLREFYENKQTFLDLYKDLISSYYNIIRFFDLKFKSILSYVSFTFFLFHVKRCKKHLVSPLIAKRNFIRVIFGPLGKMIISSFRAKFEPGVGFKENFVNLFMQPIESPRCNKGTCSLIECKPTVLHVGQGQTKIISGCRQEAAHYSIPAGKKINWENILYATIGLGAFTCAVVGLTADVVTIVDGCASNIDTQQVAQVAEYAQEKVVAAGPPSSITESQNISSHKIKLIPSISEDLKKYYDEEHYKRFIEMLAELKSKKPPVN